MKFETLVVRTGSDVDKSCGAVAPGIHLSTTFEHGPESEDLHGFMYIREGNPTQARLEGALASIEGAEAALVFASGMAAGATFLQTLEPGTHVIFPDDMYMDFTNLARNVLPRWGLSCSVVDTQDIDQVQKAMRPSTKLVWLETPSNPLLKICDIRAICQISHSNGANVIVDNTFATPALQNPIQFGADAVLHSTTKYCGGHSDVQGGAIILKKRNDQFERLSSARKLLGTVASPFNSWLVLRGLRTISCRMERHSMNALKVAEVLFESKSVETVYYPGLPSHPLYQIARSQMSGGFGGMLSFQVRGDRNAAVGVARRLKLFINATSLGGTESLVEHRASTEGKDSTTPANLLRLSVGLEHSEDLIADLMQALKE